MSHKRHYQRRIHQKIRFARQLLEVEREVESEAALEAAVWHLSVAYKAWLAEIVHDQHHPLESRDTSSATAIAASTNKHLPAALAACVELEAHSDSWLSQLQAYAVLADSLINAPPKQQLPNRIALSEQTELALPAAEDLMLVVDQFETMVERYREAMLEY